MTAPLATFAADNSNSYKVKYNGGSLPKVKTGSDLKMHIEGNTVRFMNGEGVVGERGRNRTFIAYERS